MDRYGMEQRRGGAWRIAALVLAVLVFSALGYAGLRPARAQTSTPQPEDGVNAGMERTLSTSGTGLVDVAPDRAVVTLGVFSEAEMASDAMTETNETMQTVVDALVEAGVDEDDIQTEIIRLDPVYEQPQTSPNQQQQGMPELVGFRATNTVRLTLTSLENVGEVLDAAVSAGANRIEGIRFEVSDSNDVMEQARQAAWNDAEAKAEQLAELAGATLGPVVTINASDQGPSPFARGAVYDEASLGGGAPIQPGQQTVRVDLQVTWALEE